MSHEPALTTWSTPAQGFTPYDDPRPFGPVAVPTRFQVRTDRPSRAARRPSARASARVRAPGWGRPRRRLRREVRLAGYLFLMVAPMALGLTLLVGAPATTIGGPNQGSNGVAVARPPSVWLSIEAPGIEPAPPVVFPGYLLPDDGTGNEEPAHAGG